MKCVCGYEEPKYSKEEIEVYYKSGKRKGEIKGYNTICHYVADEDKFIEIKVEKGFSFVVKYSTWDDWTKEVSLYACPKCHTVKMVS